MKSGWWTEKRRGELLGFRVRRGWRRAHLEAVRNDGPGAVGYQALCRGLQPYTLCNSELNLEDQQQCESWQQVKCAKPAGLSVDDLAADERESLCPRCVVVLEKGVAARV